MIHHRNRVQGFGFGVDWWGFLRISTPTKKSLWLVGVLKAVSRVASATNKLHGLKD